MTRSQPTRVGSSVRIVDPFPRRTDCNVHRLNKLADHIETVPYVRVREKEKWAAPTGGTYTPGRRTTGFSMSVYHGRPAGDRWTRRRFKKCESVACLSTWAFILFGKGHCVRTPFHEGVDLLGLTAKEGRALFNPAPRDRPWWEPIRSWVRGRMKPNSDITPQQAAQAIRRFLAGWPLDTLYDFTKETP